MKIFKFIIIFLFITANIFGQTRKNPKNLKQAVNYLNIECPDNFKDYVKFTEDSRLKKLCYPWGGDFKTIFNWLNMDPEPKLEKYLNKKKIVNYKETVILIAFKKFLNGEKVDEKAILKPYQEIEARLAEEDINRSTTDSLRGIYIPKDLDDSFRQINLFWADSTKTKLKNLSEDEFSGRLHMGFGMWMRNNWQLWEGSRLSAFFNDRGIYHPDDMSGIILKSYHRYLNSKDIKLEEQLEYYKAYWEKAKEDDLLRTREEFNQYKVGDTIIFKYPNGFVSKQQENLHDDESCISKGVITALNTTDFLIRVKLYDACDRRGIIHYDNKDSMVYDPKTKKYSKPKRRIIKYMKVNKENWFNYEDWEAE